MADETLPAGYGERWARESGTGWPTSPDSVPGDGDTKAGGRLTVTSRSIQLLRRA